MKERKGTEALAQDGELIKIFQKITQETDMKKTKSVLNLKRKKIVVAILKVLDIETLIIVKVSLEAATLEVDTVIEAENKMVKLLEVSKVKISLRFPLLLKDKQVWFFQTISDFKHRPHLWKLATCTFTMLTLGYLNIRNKNMRHLEALQTNSRASSAFI